MGRKPFDPIAFVKEQAKAMGLEVDIDLNQQDAARREADSVVLYVENPALFRETDCRQCGRHFATNYGSVAMCSDKCRRDWLRNIGIEWNPNKSQDERWAGRIPLVVPPDALPLAKAALESVQ